MSTTVTEQQTSADPPQAARRRPAGGRIVGWLIEREPNGLHRCEAHFAEPVRAWDGLYAAKWAWAHNSPEEAAAGLLLWLRHQQVDIPDDLLAFAENAADRRPDTGVDL